MKQQQRRKTIIWAVILSEGTHVFCCVLPTLFSVLSFMTGAGMIGVMPGFMVSMHDVLHHYEVPMIFISALILSLGWALHVYSQKIDCHDTGCGHGPCGPKKSKTHFLLIGATALFFVNVSVYFLFHRAGFGLSAPTHEIALEHPHDHTHDHVEN